MDDNHVVAALRARGYLIGPAVVRTDGKLLWQVNEIFMFRQDAADLATGTATIPQILTRNEGQVFPDAGDRDQQIVGSVDRVACEVVAGGGIEIHVAFPYELSERENELVRKRIAWWLEGRAHVS